VRRNTGIGEDQIAMRSIHAPIAAGEIAKGFPAFQSLRRKNPSIVYSGNRPHRAIPAK